MTAAVETFRIAVVHPMGLLIAGALAALGVAIVAAEWVIAFWREVRQTGGLLAQYAKELALARRPVKEWWQREDAGLPERLAIPSILDQTIDHKRVVGVPPWHPDAASLTTGYTRWHAQSLKELLERGMS